MGLFRFLLAMWVACVHGGSPFGAKMDHAYAAVQCFFIISGYYMALILNEKYRGPGSTKTFYGNRFLRLFPAYWVTLFVTLVFCWSAARWGGAYVGAWKQLVTQGPDLSVAAKATLATTNATVLGQVELLYLRWDAAAHQLVWSHTFLGSNPELWRFLFVPQAWSLELEVLFYLLAPFLVRHHLGVLVGCIAASFALRLWLCLGQGLNMDPWTYRFFPTEAGLFLLGSLAYRLNALPAARKFLQSRVNGALACTALALTLVLPFLPTIPAAILWPYYFAVAASIPWMFERSKAWKRDRWIGELSYPIYITHFLAIWTVQVLEKFHLAKMKEWMIAGLTIVLAILLSRFVIEPVEGLRRKRADTLTKPKPAPLAEESATTAPT